ncbi:hypothetical protein KIW84_046433 [Lathyrus oleraceus]|uniref:Uncharacterized protein n=1 Tax=Pisum sativum TaxID=3888 RepID=A0A9D5AT73_PEA|nr:hypothetical protein KIW84_046433 [Pisum sativum]
MPAHKDLLFTTTHDYQTEALIPVYEGGEGKQPEENHLLGYFKIMAIPDALKGVPEITAVPVMPMVDDAHGWCAEALHRTFGDTMDLVTLNKGTRRGMYILYEDVKSCPYEDVQILWSILDDGASSSSLSEPPSEYNSSSNLHLSPFLSNFNHPSSGFDIELVDCDAWGVSSVVTQAWQQGGLAASEASSCGQHVIDESLDAHSTEVHNELDSEDIDNMRVRASLFCKLGRSSIVPWSLKSII